jgi:hypothetical protein
MDIDELGKLVVARVQAVDGITTTPKRRQPSGVRAMSKSTLTSSLSLRVPKNAE